MDSKYKPYLSLFIIGVLLVAFYVSIIAVLVLHLQPPLNSVTNVSNKTPTVSFVLYEGEMADGKMGFGTSPNSLTSPGPTLRFRITDVVNVTVVNIGKMPHAFAVTNMPKTGANTLFGATIGSATNPLSPGKSGTVIFAPSNAGSSFYYICPISGHAEAGMWGSVIVSG